jgi:hypothetical protein
MTPKYQDRGWTCPKCERTLAPWVESCDVCAKDARTMRPRVDALVRLLEEVLA